MNIFSFAAHFGIKAINEVVKQNTDNQSISYVDISNFWELHIDENLLKIPQKRL